ncbi:hypothetical protein RI129_013135 [Pyrocoelia pectoralis]|uniref:EGF-like domain-containing protein n=1 Tax=Pyrocoelia pectoralis TaxID=417401 RepID=A0AAN7Z7E5_9COLE
MNLCIPFIVLILHLTSATENPTPEIVELTRLPRLADYYYYPDRTYYTNPYIGYRSQGNPYNGKVYVTDGYGQTRLAGSSSYSRGRALKVESNLPVPHIKMCSGSTCGINAHCTTIGDRPVCSCLKGYTGDPLYNCIRAECLDNTECRGHLACRNQRCVDPCQGVCGSHANCETRNHIPTCTCPPGHTGDPFKHCRVFDPEELCHPSPCGANTICEVVNNVPTCKCQQGYHGSPIAGCRHECDSDTECGHQHACIEFRCQNPCSQCGKNAECEVVQNHVPLCKCPRGYFGNPLTSCQPECTQHSDCPRSKPACFYNSCKNPCDGVCGINANCELRNGITPVCSCPKDMTGDPFTRCRPFTKEDLCDPNPCGSNAKCQPGYDRYNQERPVCTCHPGYIGDPITGCIRGECADDNECPDHQACFEYKCQNPCRGQCGANAVCNSRKHVAVCTCLEGYNGDALSNCYRVEGSEAKVSESYFCKNC